MKRELELYLVGCNDDEMQRFIRFVLDMSPDALSLIYQECGSSAKRKIKENSSKRMNLWLENPEDITLGTEDYPEIEEQCLQYFKSEDFREYRDLKVKSVLDIMKTMRKKGFPEKYISTFRLARYMDRDEIHHLIHHWFDIFLLEEALGFPMDTIMPVFRRKDSYSCEIRLSVLLEDEEFVLGELSQIHKIAKKKDEFSDVREQLRKQHTGNRVPERQEWQNLFVHAYKKYYGKTKRNDLELLYKMMHLVGNRKVMEGIIPEGSCVNVWTDAGFLYRFCFYKEYTLMRHVNPFDKTDYVMVDEEKGRAMDMSVVQVISWVHKGAIRIGKPESHYKRFGLSCRDNHFGTINGE